MGKFKSIVYIVLLYHYIPLYAQIPDVYVEGLLDSVMVNDSLAEYYHNIGDDSKAILYATKNVGINQNCGENSVPYAVAKLKLARYLSDSQADYEQELSISSLLILKDSLGTNSSIYIKYLLEHAWRLCDRGTPKEAILITEDVAEYKMNIHDSLAGYLFYSYSYFLREDNRNEEAITYALVAKDCFEKEQLVSDEYYSKTLVELARLSFETPNTSLSYLNQAKDNILKYRGDKSIDYLEILLETAYFYKANNDLEKTLRCAIEAKNIGEQIKVQDYSAYYYSVEFLSKSYSFLGQYNEAIKYAEECLILIRDDKSLDLSERLPVLDSLANYNKYVGDIKKSNYYCKEAYLIKKNLNEDKDDLLRTLFCLIETDYSLNKYEECEQNIMEFKRIYANDFTPECKYYFEVMDMYIRCCAAKGNDSEGLKSIQEVMNNYTYYYSSKSEYYLYLLKTLAGAYYRTGNINMFYEVSKTVLDCSFEIYGESDKYISEMIEQASKYAGIGNNVEASSLFQKSYSIFKGKYGVQNLKTIISWLLLVGVSDKLDDQIDIIPIDSLKQSFFSLRRTEEILLKSHDVLNESLNTQLSLLSSSLLHLSKLYSEPSSLSILYDCILLLKKKDNGYLTLRDRLANDMENMVLEKCDMLTNYTKEYNSRYFSYQTNERDSLNKRISIIVDDLNHNSLLFSRYYKMLTTDSIKDALKDGEIAIDYICYQDFKGAPQGLIVSIEKNRECPTYESCDNLSSYIERMLDLHSRVYLLTDDSINDSIIHYSIDSIQENQDLIIGFEKSLNRIFDKESNDHVVNRLFVDDSTVPLFTPEHIFEEGVLLYESGMYKNAINNFSKCDSILLRKYKEDSNRNGYGKLWIASCYHKMGLDSIASKYGHYYYLQPIDMRQTVLSDSLLDVADSLYEIGNKKEALEKYHEASRIEKEKLGKNSYWYANTLSRCASVCNELGEYERAIDFESDAINIREKMLGEDHIDYYWSLKNIFDSYVGLNNIDNIIRYGELLIEYMEEHKKEIGWEYNFYSLYTSMMARIFADNNIQKSQYYCNKTIEAANTLYDIPVTYAELYHDIIMTLLKIGNDSVAFQLCNHIIPVYEKEINNGDIKGFSDVLNIAANHYFNQGDFITASVYQERALNEIKENESILYGTILSNLALSYSEIGRIEEAIQLAEKGVRLFEEDTINMKNLDIYADRLNSLAHCYSLSNRPKDALRVGKRCFDLLNTKFGLDNHQTLVAANNLAYYYNELGYTDEAGDLLFLVVEHAEKDIQKSGDILSTAYENLAMDWARMRGDFQTSLNFINKSYELRKKMLGDNNLFTIQSLYNKGRCHLDSEEYTEGIACINQALYLTKGLIGEKNLRYVTMMKVLTEIYGNAGFLDRAIIHEEDRFALLKEVVDDTHISYTKSLENLSELYFYSNDTLKLYHTILEESNNYRKMVISEFPNYTSIERANVVNEMGRFFDWLFPLVCYYKPQPVLCSELYNALLLRRGILLNSEIEFSRLVRDSGDSILISHYYDLLAKKTLLNKQYQLPEQQRAYNIDSLKHIIYQIEDYLVSESKVYGDFTKRFRTNWKEIREKLDKDELCVEFIEFYDTCTIQNRIYYALIIDKHSESPELVPLCMESQIHKIMNGNNKGGLYQLIWDPIFQKKKSIKTVYFSPSGILNSIGIEYLEINDHENISDKYTLYRLSSTREIIEKQQPSCKSAALYGGLDYSVDTEVLLAQNNKAESGTSTSEMYRGLSDSLSVRNSFEPLYNTKIEIKEIDKALKKGKVSVSMFSDSFGTEESFKALSRQGINIIHLATHGMYIGIAEAESQKRDTNLSFILLDEKEGNYIQEDKSLSRSFLVMSGGDMLPNHREIPDNLEDGILTASEISKLDLRGLDLVVLSACQTALGDVDNEGVYGLQRGFKKAGANTILMSLDKVDDEATRILMVEFYRNLMSGKTKHQSLKDAQHYLRMIQNGKYDDPKYWASFIMLDGLN